MTIPTLTQMMKAYRCSAEIERMKCGRPGKKTVANTILGVKRFRQWLNLRRQSLGYGTIGFDEDFPLVSIIKPPLIHQYLADMLQTGTKPITAMSYVYQLRQLFARWTYQYYSDRGWKIPSFPNFGKRPVAPHYHRPTSEQLSKVKDWYRTLPPGNLWFVATMMLEFAMRNGDIMRLQRQNFVESDGRMFLNYTPNKTRFSSGRMVKWPIHSQIWQKIKQLKLDYNEDTFRALNIAMRSLGFTGSKGAYELRKICIDHVYQRFGAEMAVSISGDNINTITHYYADPSQPNLGEVQIVDLL